MTYFEMHPRGTLFRTTHTHALTHTSLHGTSVKVHTRARAQPRSYDQSPIVKSGGNVANVNSLCESDDYSLFPEM